MAMTLAALSAVLNVFAHPNTGSCVRIPLDIWMSAYVYSVFMMHYVGSGLQRDDPLSKDS
jgi:hypothetical protein